MIHFATTLEIARPPADVFAYLDDLAKTPTWLARCVEVKQTSPVPRAVGSTLHYTYSEGGRRGTMDGTVTAYEPGALLGMTYRDKIMEVVLRFEVQPSGAGTKLVHTIDITPQTFVFKLMSPIIRAATRKATARDTAKLKELLEKGG